MVDSSGSSGLGRRGSGERQWEVSGRREGRERDRNRVDDRTARTRLVSTLTNRSSDDDLNSIQLTNSLLTLEQVLGLPFDPVLSQLDREDCSRPIILGLHLHVRSIPALPEVTRRDEQRREVLAAKLDTSDIVRVREDDFEVDAPVGPVARYFRSAELGDPEVIRGVEGDSIGDAACPARVGEETLVRRGTRLDVVVVRPDSRQ